MAESFTTADFHNVVQKHILNALYEQMGAEKMDWQLIQPFLEAARDLLQERVQGGRQRPPAHAARRGRPVGRRRGSLSRHFGRRPRRWPGMAVRDLLALGCRPRRPRPGKGAPNRRRARTQHRQAQRLARRRRKGRPGRVRIGAPGLPFISAFQLESFPLGNDSNFLFSCRYFRAAGCSIRLEITL